MEQPNKETLVKVIGLLKAGDTNTALPLLANFLKSEPESVQAWYLLGLAIDDGEKKKSAFKRVLKLDPTNEKAKKQLERLEKPPEPEQEIKPAPKPEPEPTPLSEPPSHDNFELPDWMQDSSFDPSDYSSDAPEFPDSQVYENTEEDIPEWAQQNPLETQAEEIAPEVSPELLMEEDRSEEDPDPAPLEESHSDSELTGYYDEVDDESAESLDWVVDKSEDDQPDEEQVTAFFSEDNQLDDPEEVEQPEWLREMVEDDDGGKKKRKKKEKVPKKLLSPDQKRRRRKIITNIFIILVCIGLISGGYYYQDELKPYVEPYLSPILSQVAPVTDLLTQGAPLTYLLTPGYNITPTGTKPPPQQPTSEPTWTPAAGQSTTGTQEPNQVPSASPTIIPTALPLPEDTVAEMMVIEEQIRAVRNLPGPLNVEREILPNIKLRQIMEAQLISDEILAQLKNDEIVLRALGFINDNYDLTQAFLNSLGDALGGFYEPDENKIHLLGSSFEGVEKYIYAHEYSHAIQDANFDLNSLGYYPSCTKPFQACLAAQALVEGDATLVDQLWLDQYPPEEGLNDILDYQPPTTLFQGEAEPPYFAMNTLFTYEYGLSFVNYLYENGGWNGVNRAYAVLPETTEQVLHPVKYQQREAPLFLDHPDLSPVFRDEWEFIHQDSLGEWESYLLLAFNDHTDARRPEEEAVVAAEGWGADETRVYYNPAINDVFLSVYWIWDTTEEASQFYNSLQASLSTRFGTNEVDGPGESGICWFYTQQMSCLYQNEQQVLWLYSDNPEILEAAKAKFTKFP
jgi:hypothetical protein